MNRSPKAIRLNRAAAWTTVCVAGILTTDAASADEPPKKEYVPEKVEPGKKAPDGWIPRLSLQVTGSLGDNRSVVGQPDGVTIAFGLKFDASGWYYRGKHEWRNDFSLAAAMTKTPVIDELIKSQDQLVAESIYLYRWLPWFGPFARVALEAPMFRGADVRPGVTPFLVARTNGSTDAVALRRLPLSDPFQPLTLKQSAGPFARPVASDPITLELRAGAGARETFADGQLAVTDNKDTPQVEVKELADVFQAGIEFTANVWGDLFKKRVSYRLGADVMIPLAHSDLPAGDTRNSLDLTNITLGALFKFPLVEWASLNYELKAVRQPQLLDAFQVQNNLLLTVGLSYNPVKPSP